MAVKTNVPAAAPATQMYVRKRSGSLEPLDPNKIIRAVTRAAKGIADVDPVRVATETIGSLNNNISTQEVHLISIETAASLNLGAPELLEARRLAARRGYP